MALISFRLFMSVQMCEKWILSNLDSSVSLALFTNPFSLISNYFSLTSCWVNGTFALLITVYTECRDNLSFRTREPALQAVLYTVSTLLRIDRNVTIVVSVCLLKLSLLFDLLLISESFVFIMSMLIY